MCFDDEGRLKIVVSPRYSMEFHDYRGFGKKRIARNLTIDPEPGTKLVGNVVQLEDLSKAMWGDLFTHLGTNDSRFESVQLTPAKLEELTAADAPVVWPPIRSGNLKGKLAMYVSIDNQGHVREAWPLNSDNAGLEDPTREQVGKWTIPPAVDSAGNPVQVDGALGFSFSSAIDNPIPVLSDKEARQLAIKIVEPQFPQGMAPAGSRYGVRVSLDERGAVVGQTGSGTVVPVTGPSPGVAVMSIMKAVREWQFRPLMKNGVPQYFFAELVFTVR